MKDIILLVLFVVLMGMSTKLVVAQPEMRYPNPAYLHWEEPCPEYFSYVWSYANGLQTPSSQHHNSYLEYVGDICYVNPFGREEESQTVYGVALPLALVGTQNWQFYPYSLLDRKITLDIMLYQFAPGDSNVQLIKRQTFVVEQNQQPDLMMVYKEAHYALGLATENIDSLIKLPMYEFYLDLPEKLEGNFYVGVYSADSFYMPTPCMVDISPRAQLFGGGCCHHGYWGYLDMDKNMLLRYTNVGLGALCESGRQMDGLGFDVHGVLAPQTDTMYNNIAQFAFPITKPRGYLTAIEPTAGAAAGGVRLSPNPARTQVTVEADCAIRHVEVADMAGRVLIAERYDADVRSATLDVGRLAQGIYAVRVYTEREEAVQKLIIE